MRVLRGYDSEQEGADTDIGGSPWNYRGASERDLEGQEERGSRSQVHRLPSERREVKTKVRNFGAVTDPPASKACPVHIDERGRGGAAGGVTDLAPHARHIFLG